MDTSLPSSYSEMPNKSQSPWRADYYQTIVDNFLIAEESIPKIYLIFISPPGLKSHQVCLYHVTFFWEDMNKFLFNPDRKLMTDGQSDFPEV